MARQRRTGRSSFRPPELKGTLGTLINTALSQAGVVRDVLERGAREGRARIDDARAGRRRHEALAELGEVVLELIRKGEIDLGELPEARELVRHLDDLDNHDSTADDESLDEIARAPSRARFDQRADDTDGTVSSRNFSRSKPTVPQRVWRPQAEEPPPAIPSRDTRTRDLHPPRLPNNPTKKGGIAFDDDDLAEYMHPDDVPPKSEE